MTGPKRVDTAGEDPFVALLRGLVHDPAGGDGQLKVLSARSGVPERTLRDWLGGRYPKRKSSQAVDGLHIWALQQVKSYQSAAQAGRSLNVLSGPRRTRPATAASVSFAPSGPAVASGLGGDGEARTPPPESPGRAPGPASTRGRSERSRRRRWVVAAVVVVVAVIVGALTQWWGLSAPDHRAPVAAPGTVATPTVRETSDNHNGTPVYASPQGAAVPPGVPQRIPYGVVVDVACRTANSTGESSVTALYRIADGRWAGMYAVSDTFTNGDAFGTPGSTLVDTSIPICR